MAVLSRQKGSSLVVRAEVTGRLDWGMRVTADISSAIHRSCICTPIPSRLSCHPRRPFPAKRENKRPLKVDIPRSLYPRCNVKPGVMMCRANFPLTLPARKRRPGHLAALVDPAGEAGQEDSPKRNQYSQPASPPPSHRPCGG